MAYNEYFPFKIYLHIKIGHYLCKHINLLCPTAKVQILKDSLTIFPSPTYLKVGHNSHNNTGNCYF